MQYFNIQVASQLSGVASATIRAWEKRYNAVIPERGDNKHRLYSEKDIEKLALLFRLTEVGQSIGKIAHLELQELKGVYETLMHKPYEEANIVTPHHEKVDYEKMLNNFLIALTLYKLDIISHELEKAKNMLTPKEFCLNLIIPLFQQIGRKVLSGELTIAQEHTLSALCNFQIGQMIGSHYQKKILKRDLYILAAPEGELHEIGLLACSLLCVHYGIRFIYMGVNLPSQSLAEAANALNAKFIMVGTTTSSDSERAAALENYLSQLSVDLKGPTQILVGGNLKSSTKSELERRRVPFFPTIEAFDEYLQNVVS